MKLTHCFSEGSKPSDEIAKEECIFDCKPFQGQNSDATANVCDVEKCLDGRIQTEFIESKQTNTMKTKKCTHRHFSSTADLSEDCMSDYTGIFKKVKLNSSKLENTNESWSMKSFTLTKTNELIRSAPECVTWDIENNGERITLPVLGCGRSDSIKRISGVTVINLISGYYKKDYVLIDARFKYEYEGGHITTAVNASTLVDLEKTIKPNTVIIFYCELSSVRGPGLAKKLRSLDRMQNDYPNLKYPEIYVLEGGYRKFYQKFSEFCSPNSYIQMNDKRFKQECVNNHKVLKLNKSK